MRTIQEQESGMYNKSENTCLKAKDNNPACMTTGKTHVQQAKNGKQVCKLLQKRHV